jgi:3D-(3,5/4)-trihydroxycyclohexane-1,2-dione acylhydrolase (decyclizing)
MGAIAERVDSMADLPAAFARAKAADRSYVIVVPIDQYTWTEGGAWWEVGVPEVSDRPAVRAAREALEDAKRHQRVGV